ncbi:helix-turn-helix domain-containing protein [uncultured Parasutterella sp.]|uniref:TetR/AcrR family transcriptional regulator n=1 Tax=uncultured Parasutterella sp. TaxID=1263098 RepID=UPI00262C8311|nr:helix-turn-helix domain-containing protein [uncultured Parasutterella sp.]
MTKTSEILPIKKKVGRPAKNLNGKTVRQIVLDEARKLVSQHGTDSLSFDRLSKETGIAKGTILYQFKRKEDLLLALLQAHASELEAKFKTVEKKIEVLGN